MATVAEDTLVILKYPCRAVVSVVTTPPIFQYVLRWPSVAPDATKLIVDEVALRVIVTPVPEVAEAVIVISSVLSSRNGPPKKS